MHRWVKELASLAVLFLLLFSARSTLADHYYVPSGSMQHTLEIGDRVLVDKRAYGLRLPFTLTELIDTGPVLRGDVVIFDSPVNGRRLIKRIVAVGGDRFRIANGHLQINGRWLGRDSGARREAFDGRQALLRLDSGGGPDLDGRVPEGMLLAVGDHRGNSFDGRMFGFIPEGAVYGRAVAVYHRRGEGFTWRSL